MNEMIGKGFECQELNYKEGYVRLDGWWFNLSDVQELTPLKYEGKSIAIGDEVEYEDDWYTVYGYYWDNGEWCLQTVEDENFNGGCYEFRPRNIDDHRTPHSESLSKEEWLKKGREAGYLEDGKVVK